MKFVSVMIAVGVITLFASGSGAEPASGDAPQTATAVAKTPKPKPDPHDPNAIVCKTEVTTGSRLNTEKTCMTRAQWQDTAQRSKDWLNNHRATSMQQDGGR